MSIGRSAKDLFYYGINPYLLQLSNYIKDRNINNPYMFNLMDRFGNIPLGNINRVNSNNGSYPYMYPYIKE